jgi:hypothetical protein
VSADVASIGVALKVGKAETAVDADVVVAVVASIAVADVDVVVVVGAAAVNALLVAVVGGLAAVQVATGRLEQPH